jgi:hypothetical protein
LAKTGKYPVAKNRLFLKSSKNFRKNCWRIYNFQNLMGAAKRYPTRLCRQTDAMTPQRGGCVANN